VDNPASQQTNPQPIHLSHPRLVFKRAEPPLSPIHAKLPLPNLKVRVLDVSTVLITYDSEATYDGVVEYAHRSSIWSRTEGRWVMRFHQGTPCQPSSPKPGGQSAA
jgi:hypothetical protein